MEQGIARYTVVSVGGALSSRGMNARTLRVARRDSEADRPGKRGAGDCGYQRAWHQHLRRLPQLFMSWMAKIVSRYRSANGAPH